MRRVWKSRFRLRTGLIAVALCAVVCAPVFEGPRWWERRQQRQRHLALLAALDRPVTIRLAPPATLHTGLKAIRVLEPVVPIYVDPIGLSEAGVSINTPVALDVRGVPLSEAMTRLLKPLGLTHYVGANRVVVITSEGSADLPRAD